MHSVEKKLRRMAFLASDLEQGFGFLVVRQKISPCFLNEVTPFGINKNNTHRKYLRRMSVASKLTLRYWIGMELVLTYYIYRVFYTGSET
jgi:hypothetical protein